MGASNVQNLTQPSVAIVHDWLVTYAGAEKVLEQLLLLFPQADVFTLVDVLPEADRGFLQGHRVYTSFIQKLPWVRRKYRHYLPLMPLAVEQFDLSTYDVVISSSHAVAKGVITGPNQLHISYVHSPMRYAWDLQHQYLRESGLQTGMRGWLVKYMLHKLRLWDVRTAPGVDVFVSNSTFIAQRIWKVYRREAQVIYPPVDVAAFSLHETKENFYLAASRLVPYKKMDLIIEAFKQMSDQFLVVIGDGPDAAKLTAIAAGYPNIRLLGYQPQAVLKDYMQRAKALVFAAEEDFGITPVEAQACGTPVIAFARGGALETVIDGVTGIFFTAQTADAVRAAVMRFDHLPPATFSPQACRESALRFTHEVFAQRMQQLVQQELQARG